MNAQIDSLKSPAPNGAPYRWLPWIGLLGLGLAVALMAGMVHWSLQQKERELTAALASRLELMASGRVEVISTWLEGLVLQGDRVVQSDLFRLYASEVDLIDRDLSTLVAPADPEGDDSLGGLQAQLPMMRNLLTEFSRYAGFLSARVIHRSGQSYIATDGNTAALGQVERALALEALSTGRTSFAPLRMAASGLVLDLYLPIFGPQGGAPRPKPVAVLQLSRSVTENINEFNALHALAQSGESVHLLQAQNGTAEAIRPWLPRPLTAVELALPAEGSLAFARRPGLDGTGDVFSLGHRVPELGWWVVQQINADIALAPLDRYMRTAIGITALAALLLLAIVGAIWWRVVGQANRRLAERFQALASEIEQQHRFLDSINVQLTDMVALKDLKGLYRFVNPAFARAVGRTPAEAAGLDDTALFGFDTARRLDLTDRQVLETRQVVTLEEDIYLQSQPHRLLITKAPYLGAEGELDGLLVVIRDVTDLVREKRRSERTVHQTVQALVKTIELRDPYLAGHSRLMSLLSGLVARQLQASAQEIATVEIAAYLSQIGKAFIPEAILNKPGVLTPEEKRQMEQHVEHSAKVLQNIDFDLPVAAAVAQMNEHLDGSGYPAGLAGDAILRTARILAATNAFCAMVRTRAYRSARSREDALRLLAESPGCYDADIVRALGEVAGSHEGEKLLGHAGEATA